MGCLSGKETALCPENEVYINRKFLGFLCIVLHKGGVIKSEI